MHSWVDGVSADVLAVSNRGLAYGDGLFETLLVRGGRPRLFERHLARLLDGCQRLHLPLDSALLTEEAQRFATAMGDGVLKVIVTRGDAPRGYAIDPLAAPRRILQAAPLPAYPSAHAEEGVALFQCAMRLAEQPALAGLKHLNRLEQVLARSEWSDPRWAEGLMCDTSGRVIEGVYSNLFMVCDGRLCTPALARCGVAGVMRAELLAQAQALGMETLVADFSLDDLACADEVFVCNSVYGVWPVLTCGAARWQAGAVTRKLQRIARELLDA